MTESPSGSVHCGSPGRPTTFAPRPSLVAFVGVIAVASICLTGCLSNPTPPPDVARSTTTEPPNRDGRSPASYFKVGDCLKDVPQSGKNVTIVDCAKPHLVEVYGVLRLPDGNLPDGIDAKSSKERCVSVARTFVSPQEGLDPSMRTLVKFPDATSWSMGDRSITCFLAFSTARTGAFGAGRWIK